MVYNANCSPVLKTCTFGYIAFQIFFTHSAGLNDTFYKFSNVITCKTANKIKISALICKLTEME